MTLRRAVGSTLAMGATALLTYLFIRHFDFERLSGYLGLRGALVVFMLVGFQLLILALYTAQWVLLLRGAGVNTGPAEAFFARLGGTSVTYVSMPVSVGGEVVRAGLIAGSDAGFGRVTATIAADKAVEIGTRLPAIALGLFMISAISAQGSPLRPAGVLLAVLLMVAAAVMIVLLRRPLPAPACGEAQSASGGEAAPRGDAGAHRLLRAAGRLAPRLAARLTHGLAEFRTSLRLVLRRRRLLAGAILLGFSASMVDVLQLFLLLHMVGLDLLGGAFVMYASSALQGSVAFLPGNAGGMEATSMFVFKLLGADPQSGIVYALLLRAAQMVWVAVGLGYLGFRSLRGKSVRARGVRQELRDRVEAEKVCG